jgi:hypothetical protein
MGKFLSKMTQNGDGTLMARARQIDTQAAIEVDNIIAELKSEQAELKLKLEDLTDFAPETTQSLRPGVANWNPKTWARNIITVKTRLYENAIQLQIAEQTKDEFFGEEATDVVEAQ